MNCSLPLRPPAALCSLLVLLSSGAVAQTNPDAAPALPDDSAAALSSTEPIETTPTKEQCLESHQQAQVAQNEGKLLRARDLARICTSLACPGLIVADCASWLNDSERRIPSVVFEVHLDGETDLSAKILADGAPVADWTHGEALRLDPGEHEFRFELPPHEPIVQTILVTEGMRYRVLSADFETRKERTPAPMAAVTREPLAAAPPPLPPTNRPTPFLVYPLLGLGTLAAAGFATFGLIGESKRSDLESSCEPDCKQSDLTPVTDMYLLADVSLGVSVASLITAGVFYLTRAEEPMAASIGFSPLPGGGASFATYEF